jgi:[ribosomal protein S18]-alanine N-acetyltransferase
MYRDRYTHGPLGELQVRSLVHRDLARLEQLELASFEEPWNRQRIEAAHKRGRVLVIESESKRSLVGYLVTRDRAPACCSLLRLAVHPAHRRRGFGLWLVQTVLDQLGRCGHTSVAAKVPDDHLALQLLLQRAGFFARGFDRRTGRILMTITRDEWIGSLVIDRLAEGETRVLEVV